jgi:hypothetical protein
MEKILKVTGISETKKGSVRKTELMRLKQTVHVQEHHKTCIETYINVWVKVKVKLSLYRPVEALRGCERLRLPHFQIFGSKMTARLSALCTSRSLPSGRSWYSFVFEAESTPGP